MRISTCRIILWGWFGLLGLLLGMLVSVTHIQISWLTLYLINCIHLLEYSLNNTYKKRNFWVLGKHYVSVSEHTFQPSKIFLDSPDLKEKKREENKSEPSKSVLDCRIECSGTDTWWLDSQFFFLTRWIKTQEENLSVSQGVQKAYIQKHNKKLLYVYMNERERGERNGGEINHSM